MGTTEDNPYFIEVCNNGCPHCGAGRTWNIVRPDGMALSVSYGDEEEASDLAEWLNDAYARGKSAGKPPAQGGTEGGEG